MDVDERVRAARPALATADPDLELLARAMAQPVERRRRRPVAIPVVALAALVAAAVVLLGGSRPDDAAALGQALRWFDPPAGTVLHSVRVDGAGNTREVWQDVDRPERMRTVLPGGYEVGAGAVYERATDTIYEDDGTARRELPTPDAGRTGSGARSEDAERPTLHITPRESAPSGDPLIARVRVQLVEGSASVRGRELHDGIDAWKIALSSGDGPPSILWVRADDGRPLALDGARWTTYEVLDHGAAAVTLREAHPDARVVTDGARFKALLARASGGAGAAPRLSGGGRG